MALPKISLPLFELTLPSTGEKINYRPFTVKEEKILLIAQESKDLDQIMLAVKQIIENCAQLNTDKLATFDLEYLLINIRAKSVNNLVSFKIMDPDTKKQVELSIDLEAITIKTEEGHNKLIRLGESSAILMRYPTLAELASLAKSKTKEASFNVMISCIDTVEYDGAVYKASDYSREELIEFVDGLTNAVIADIERFFTTMPKLRFETTYINANGVEKKFVVEGMESFFI
jgi:hypothetical protein